jgi:hypothetical protein
MAEDDMAATGILEHDGGNVAGMRAGRRGMAILATYGDVRAGERIGDRPKERCRRAYQKIAIEPMAPQPLRQVGRQGEPVGC